MIGIAMAERGWVPEPFVRAGIRRLLRGRLRAESRRAADPDAALSRFVHASPG